jgi:hypothetical protein
MPERFLHIYCDESRQTADRYMVLGGLITVRENENTFHEAMKLYRQSNNMQAELKWTKVSDQKLVLYPNNADKSKTPMEANIRLAGWVLQRL